MVCGGGFLCSMITISMVSRVYAYRRFMQAFFCETIWYGEGFPVLSRKIYYASTCINKS
ncbi:protein of unknown function [Cupriavidus taiwanensis]|nr:protein of unknown function [Cupriavidus taiwanensis]